VSGLARHGWGVPDHGAMAMTAPNVRESGKDEAYIGMEVFYSDTDGIGGRLRERFEDFIVKEISSPPPPAPDGKVGEWTIATVTAENWETNRLVRMLSKALWTGKRNIRFAGTKDKRGITTQLMAFNIRPEALQRVDLKGVTIENIFTSDKTIDIGDLIGNRFEIRITELKPGYEAWFDSTRQQLETLGGFPNFFGVQRFGAMRPVSHVVGKHLVRGEFEEAVMSYLGSPFPRETPEISEARRELEATKDFRVALRSFPNNLTFEKIMLQYLVEHPDDYAGCIRKLPFNLVMMFTHAYQGYLFNRTMSERIRRGLPLRRPVLGDLVLPVDPKGLPDHDHWFQVDENNIEKVTRQAERGKAFVSGLVFGSETDEQKGVAQGTMGEIERAIIEAEGLVGKDFIVPEVPAASSRGIRRELVAPVKEFSCEKGAEELLMRFALDKGCYATSYLREFMKADVFSY